MIWKELLPYAIIEAALLGTVLIPSRARGVIELIEGIIVEKFMFALDYERELAERIRRATGTSNGCFNFYFYFFRIPKERSI